MPRTLPTVRSTVPIPSLHCFHLGVVDYLFTFLPFYLFAFCVAAMRGKTWFEIVCSLLARTRDYFEKAASGLMRNTLRVRLPGYAIGVVSQDLPAFDP